MNYTAKRLILNLLLAHEESSLSIQDIIRACELFEIKPANVRVVVQRLVAENLLESKERGRYQLGQAASSVTKDVSTWKYALDKIQPWHGDWIGVHCALPKSGDQKAQKTRERAFRLLGCQALRPDFFIRPNNLKGEVHNVRLRLDNLGLEEDIPVFRIADFDTRTANKLQTLWDVSKIELGYKTTTQRLLQWLQKLQTLSAQQSAIESFIIGDQAIRQMIYDPLLPEEMINAADRQVFFKTLLVFDEVGKDIWRSLIDRASMDSRFTIPEQLARHLANIEGGPGL